MYYCSYHLRIHHPVFYCHHCPNTSNHSSSHLILRNLLIIPELLFFMLSYCNYSQNYSGIIDRSLLVILSDHFQRMTHWNMQFPLGITACCILYQCTSEEIHHLKLSNFSHYAHNTTSKMSQFQTEINQRRRSSDRDPVGGNTFPPIQVHHPTQGRLHTPIILSLRLRLPVHGAYHPRLSSVDGQDLIMILPQVHLPKPYYDLYGHLSLWISNMS